MTCILLLHLSKRQPWTTEPLSIFGKRWQPTAGQRHRPFKAFRMVRNPECPTTVLAVFPPPKRRGVPPGSHTWHYAHAQHRHFQPSSEVLCSRPALMINATCWEKNSRGMCWLQITCHSVCKLDSCVRGASPFHQEYQMKVYQVSPRFNFCWFLSLQVELLGNTPLNKKAE